MKEKVICETAQNGRSCFWQIGGFHSCSPELSRLNLVGVRTERTVFSCRYGGFGTGFVLVRRESTTGVTDVP